MIVIPRSTSSRDDTKRNICHDWIDVCAVQTRLGPTHYSDHDNKLQVDNVDIAGFVCF